MKEIKIIITFDLDPDVEQELNNKKERWLGLKEGTRKFVSDLKRKFNFNIPISWFVRVDDEIKNEFGDYLGLIKKNKNLFKMLKDFGGKFYLHPHLYSYDINNGVWFQETNQIKIASQLRKIFISAKKNLYLNNKVIRIGGHYFSREILKILLDNKVILDSSCLPGRKSLSSKPFDWSNSSQKKHFLKNKNKKLLEVPPTMIRIKASYDKKAYNRYLDLTYKSLLVKKYKKNINFNLNNYVMTLSHPSQFITKKKHGLLGNGTQNYINNLNLILNTITKKGYRYRFCHIEDLIK